MLSHKGDDLLPRVRGVRSTVDLRSGVVEEGVLGPGIDSDFALPDGSVRSAVSSRFILAVVIHASFSPPDKKRTGEAGNKTGILRDVAVERSRCLELLLAGEAKRKCSSHAESGHPDSGNFRSRPKPLQHHRQTGKALLQS
jgi:hypothetical protein